MSELTLTYCARCERWNDATKMVGVRDGDGHALVCATCVREDEEALEVRVLRDVSTKEDAMDPDNEGIERSLTAVFRGLSGGEPSCPSTHTTPDGKVWRCSGVPCVMFPGQHKAWGVDVTWSDSDADY